MGKIRRAVCVSQYSRFAYGEHQTLSLTQSVSRHLSSVGGFHLPAYLLICDSHSARRVGDCSCLFAADHSHCLDSCPKTNGTDSRKTDYRSDVEPAVLLEILRKLSHRLLGERVSVIQARPIRFARNLFFPCMPSNSNRRQARRICQLLTRSVLRLSGYNRSAFQTSRLICHAPAATNSAGCFVSLYYTANRGEC